MAGVNFSSFTLEASPSLTDFLVGYRSTAAGGERRTTNSSLNTLFQANITTGLTASALLQAGASGALTASDITYTSPTLSVPASFGITGAGSLNFTAGGLNQNITLTPSGTGQVGALFNTSIPTALSGTNALSIVAANNNVSGALIYSYNAVPGFFAMRSNGTQASRSAVGNNDILFLLGARAFGATDYAASSRASVLFRAGEAWSDSAQSAYISFNTTLPGTTTTAERLRITPGGRLSIIPANFSQSAWGTDGALFQANTAIVTDSSTAGSGTATSATFYSLAQPTLAATNASVTTTTSATFYIAGAPITGTNQTITNPKAEWIAAGLVRWGGYGAGALTTDASGNITAASDGRLKDIQREFTKGLHEINKINPVVFKWKEGSGNETESEYTGVIAQDLIAAGLGEAVFTQRLVEDTEEIEVGGKKEIRQKTINGKPATKRVDGFYTVSDRAIIATLINAIKELNGKIVALENA
jgi:hypothetical protein